MEARNKDVKPSSRTQKLVMGVDIFFPEAESMAN
jgi:hypothetical protein